MMEDEWHYYGNIMTSQIFRLLDCMAIWMNLIMTELIVLGHWMVELEGNHPVSWAVSVQLLSGFYVDVSIVMGVPQARWMVFVREDPMKMDDEMGYPHFRKCPCE